MLHTILQIRTSWRQMTAIAAMLVLTMATVAVGPAAPSASALGNNCRHYDASSTLIVGTENGPHYYSSPIAVVPSNSRCNDINLEYVYDAASGIGHRCAVSVRVRFFLSNGTSKLYRDFHNVCVGGVIASAVKNGAKYRIETPVPQHVGVYD